MLKILIATVIFFTSINPTYARDVFKPFIIDATDKEVCQLTLSHYTDLYNSKNAHTEGFNKSEKVDVPKFSTLEVDDVLGSVKIAEAEFYGEKKLFVYHGRSHSWRGDIYTGYLINQHQLEPLKSHLKEDPEGGFSPFYPMGSLAYGSNFSWWENLPFQFNNKWYVLADFGDFSRHDSQRNVYQILEDGSSEKVCTVKIFKNFYGSKMREELPFFAAYKESVEEIMLSPGGGCGTARPEAAAQTNGQFFASMAVVRPWAIEPTWKSMENQWEAKQIDFQKKHFEHWQYQDIWSYREHATYQNLMFDAITELTNHYISNYSYSKAEAFQLASGVIKAMPGRYYSLGVYYDQEKDFSAFKGLVEGNYDNWAGIPHDLKLKYDHMPITSLTLMLDNPQQYKNLPSDIDEKSVLSFYNKDILMFAAHMNNFDTVKYLVDAGWPTNKVTNHEPEYFCNLKFERLNRSALTYAAENASIETIKLLVAAGADTLIKDSKGNSLDFYIRLNPRFSEKEKESGLDAILKAHSNQKEVKPSFSCKGKLNRIETAICNSTGLSIYDRELNNNYRNALSNAQISPELKTSQINWIKRRNSECGKFTEDNQLRACLARTSRARIRYLEYVQSAFRKDTD